MTSDEAPKHTPLHALHMELRARMVPFAGYDMPVQYPPGVLKEHLHTRARSPAMFGMQLGPSSGSFRSIFSI